ncbi:DUF1054 domain-containing protein [Aerococcaceae bacterium NML190073]|nr:DUF1054 domain-containing protein [Aerococcaceae bacterium NML190073]
MPFIFSDEVFAVFDIATLEGRMAAIKEQVQPIFRHYGAVVTEQLADKMMPIHVAKHLRRTVHPPETTWVGIGGDKRGYKKYAHFQLGINEDYVFMMLAIIDNPPTRVAMATQLLDKLALLEQLPDDFVVIPDHTDIAYIAQPRAHYNELLTQLRNKQKAEFMIGRLLHKGDAILQEEAELERWVRQTVSALQEIYELLMRI